MARFLHLTPYPAAIVEIRPCAPGAHPKLIQSENAAGGDPEAPGPGLQGSLPKGQIALAGERVPIGKYYGAEGR